MCMYVCTYVCMYVCVYTCIAFMYACARTCVHCMNVCMHACMFVCLTQTHIGAIFVLIDLMDKSVNCDWIWFVKWQVGYLVHR